MGLHIMGANRHDIINRRIAQEKITEALLECEKSGNSDYVHGLVDMAYELGYISEKEQVDYVLQAIHKHYLAHKSNQKEE